MSGNVVGNIYDKYGTRNPLAAALMRGFLRTVTDMYSRVAPTSVLEVGCGEGRLAKHLLAHAKRPRRFVACDVSLSAIDRDMEPTIELREASIDDLPFQEASFDLVVCCEVLEHLPDPRRGLSEVARVARRAALVSTPREPLWRLLNVARGHYWRELGNTPGHVQHFSRRDLVRLASTSLRVVEARSPLPWTVLLGEPLHPPRFPRDVDQHADHERQADERE